MSLYIAFSNGRAVFFDDRLTSPPFGAVAISKERHAALLAGQATGKIITADAQGKPVLADPEASPLPVPDVVSRFQARMALRNAGLFEAANDAVYGSQDDLLIEAWESAVEFRRVSPSIIMLGAVLGLEDAAIDQLFRDAAAITA
ncbi:hypothetical protein [Paracoccus sp. 22332]|uniref:hypothetical protein n=1 Tax=Paracoccus sp. 22332 TaxID=3453913 RepID=UPI003F827785